jgi:hypothetical protein
VFEGLVHAPCEWCRYPTNRWPYLPELPTQYPDFQWAPDQEYPVPPDLGMTPLVWEEVESQSVPASMQNLDPALNTKYQALSRYLGQVTNFFYAHVKRNQ